MSRGSHPTRPRGRGGFTERASHARTNFVFAANHWLELLDGHRRNHPSVHHECQDLARMDMRIPRAVARSSPRPRARAYRPTG